MRAPVSATSTLRPDRQRHERKRIRKAPKRNNSKPDDDMEVTVDGPGEPEPGTAPCAS